MVYGQGIAMYLSFDNLSGGHDKVAFLEVGFPSGETRVVDTGKDGWNNIYYSNKDTNVYEYENDGSFLRITFRIRCIDDNIKVYHLKCRQNYAPESTTFKLVGCSLKNDGYGSYILKRGDD